MRMNRGVVPTFTIHAIHAEELNPALFKMMRQGRNHTEVLVLVKAAHRSGKNEHSRATVPKDEHLHLTMEHWAIPVLIGSFHVYPIRRRRPALGYNARGAGISRSAGPAIVYT